MKKYIILLLFFINFAFVFQPGKLEVKVGVEVKGQSLGNEYNDNGYDLDGYDENGYNEFGYNEFGYDVNGYNEYGYDENGYDENGYDENGFDENGFDIYGYTADDYDIPKVGDVETFNVNGNNFTMTSLGQDADGKDAWYYVDILGNGYFVTDENDDGVPDSVWLLRDDLTPPAPPTPPTPPLCIDCDPPIPPIIVPYGGGGGEGVVISPPPPPGDCAGVDGGTAYLDDCGFCVGGDTKKEPCKKDCNEVWGGKAYLDSCKICVGGLTKKEPCKKDCAGVWGGVAYTNGCDECVGGTTNKHDCFPFCLPKQFDVGIPVTPVFNSGGRFTGTGWCVFLTLATLKGDDPCAYASYFYSTYKQNLNIIGCNSAIGVEGEFVQPLMEHFGVGFEQSLAVSTNCTLLNELASNGGGKGVLVQTYNHVFLLYHFNRPDENTDTDDVAVSKYDTDDANGWDGVYPLKKINLAGTVNIIH